MAAGPHESTLEPPRVSIPHGVMRDGALIRELRLTPVAGDDQASLLDTEASTSNERANLLLERCLDEDDPATLVASLVAGDREALLLQLRRLTIGETLDCVLTCAAPECGERMELELRVGDLLVEPYGDVRATYEVAVDAVAAGEPPIVVRFRLPTVADLRAATVMGGDEADAVAADLLARCAAIGESDGAGSAEIDTAAREPIAAAMAERDPQAEIELDLECPSCATPFGVIFDTATFLLQELDARAARLLEEVHALAFHYHWSEREILAMAPTRRERYLTLLADALRGSDAAGYSST